MALFIFSQSGAEYGENLRKSGAPSTMTVGSEREKCIRVVLYKAGRKAGRDGDVIRNQSETRMTSWLSGPPSLEVSHKTCKV